MMLSVTVVYYTPGPYGPLQHTEGWTYVNRSDLATYAVNPDAVRSRPGAQHIVIDRDTRIIFQVSGYNRRHGMFSDVVPRSELAPFLTDTKG